MFKNISFFISVLLIYTAALAKEIPAKPEPPKLVNDFTGTLSAQETYSLEQKLIKYNDTTSTQITIVIENTLEGDEVFDYSMRLAQAWGIGQKGKNNGLLIYVALQDRKIRIQVGYGLESVLTDAFTKRVIEEVMKLNFKQGNYYDGLNQAVDYLIAKASGQFQSDGEQSGKRAKAKDCSYYSSSSLLCYTSFQNFATAAQTMEAGGGGMDMWTAMLLGSAMSGGKGSSYGNFSSGSGSFGGFGGGSFGGGGSGGDW